MTDDLAPGRVSSLPGLGQCPGFSVLRKLETTRTSSRAADTGSAVARMIDLHHEGLEWPDVLEQTSSELGQFPLADLDEAGAWGDRYRRDARNGGEVVVACEEEVTLTLPPAPEDPTGAPIELVGHYDQIREEGGVLRVWDVKSGKPGGLDMLYGYAWQLAAYALGATATYGETVLPGGIIRVRDYTAKRHLDPASASVFYSAPWTLEQCRSMLESAAWLIAALRGGAVPLLPGRHCGYCPAGGPHLCAEALGDHE